MNHLISLNSKYLHPLVYFIADQPGKDNISPDVPLVGTVSYRNLLGWIGIMNLDITRMRLYNQSDSPFDNLFTLTTLNKAVMLDQIKIIALGTKAKDYLLKIGIEEFFVLPHPSPKNRALNDKDMIREKLGACERYVYKGIRPPTDFKETQDQIEEG